MSYALFKFSPLEYVTVTAHGLSHRGRVIECIWDRGGARYYVEYRAGEEDHTTMRYFYEDELQPRQPT